MTLRRTGRSALSFAAALAFGIGGHPPAAATEVDDPLEPANRAVLSINLLAYDWAVAPAARLYRENTPEPVRRSVGNFLSNLRAPVVLANDLLQGETDRARTTLSRLAINSTLGVFGLFDLASGYGYRAHHEDAGQTLAVYGLPSGPYLMLPLLGPSTVRDAAGRVGDLLMLDLYLPGADAVVGATGLADLESGMDGFDATRAASLDLYAALRSAYAQARAAEIRNGAPTGDPDYDAIFKSDPGGAPSPGSGAPP